MPNTAGYEVIAEVTQAVLEQILGAAWDNSIIPHSVDAASGLAFGPYQIHDGVVNIPREGLALAMAPAANGVAITLPAEVQVEIANPPTESLTYFDMTADVQVTAPVGTLPDSSVNVGILLDGLPRSSVQVTLTSGDPIPSITLSLIKEYVHEKYEDGTIPATITMEDVTVGVFTADVFVEIFDDPNDPNHQIEVTQPAAGQVKLRIPIHLRLSNLTAPAGPQPLSPMGVEAKIAMVCPLVTSSGSIEARLSQATLDVENLTAAAGQEGANYTANKAGAALLGIDLDALLEAQIILHGQSIVSAVGNITITVPTVDQIEDFIGDQVHSALLTRGNISVWTPESPDTSVTISDVTTKALADALAICLNAGSGADPNAVTNFIPADRSCAIAMAGWKVLEIIDQTIHRPEDEGGYGPSFPPYTFPDVDGYEVILNSLNFSLEEGAILVSGSVTVVDAICTTDVDASFSVRVGLRWIDNADGTQSIQAYTLEEPDVDLPDWAWIVSLLLGFILGGLIGGIVVIIVMNVVDDLAESIGGPVITDHVLNQIRAIGAWPQTLNGIGTVDSHFENPVEIDADGVSFPDAFLVTATYALTVDALAQANGPYGTAAGSPLSLHGGPLVAATDYGWEFGDGHSAAGASGSNTYADNGLYVSKFTTQVNQPGGVRTREFAPVRVRNVRPVVEAGAPLTVDEGQEVEYVASFTDVEWPDTHHAIFDFGDDSLPAHGVVSETNAPPQAQGIARARHAYCDNGEYTVKVSIRDDNGGIGVDTRKVTVRNVPPTVDAGELLYAYPCTPVNLLACFTDPGWCDTHTGWWEFGDCTPPHPAVIREKHEPPAGYGLAVASHVYHRCGTYLARCTVVDDDGGVGIDTLVVRVVEVLNRDFEQGFRNRLPGAVANEWEPYIAGGQLGRGQTHAAVPAGAAQFFAEEFVVRRGQRSQRIAGSGGFQAGIFQSVGANPGWDYQVSVWYHLDERAGGKCRLGIDPSGGTDPAAASVAWSEGAEHRQWIQLVGRVTATGRRITVFLEAVGEERGANAYFDLVELVPYPCPLPECPPPSRPPEEEKVCVDWKDEKRPRPLGSEYQKSGFTFRALGGQPLQVVVWGLPAGQGKLLVQPKGVQVVLPFVADRVVAHVAVYTAQAILLAAFDAAGNQVGQAGTISHATVETLEIKAAGIATLVISGGGNEGLLVDLCAYRTVDSGSVPVSKKESESKRQKYARRGCRD